MEAFAIQLLERAEIEIQQISVSKVGQLCYYEACIKIYVAALEKLKGYFLQTSFKNKQEEVYFFKTVKPKFVSKLIFYNELYTIKISENPDQKIQRRFIRSRLEKIETFYDENVAFYRYYKSENRAFDKVYFCRKKPDVKMTLDSFYFQADHRFNTSHDYLVARIIANEMIQFYLQNELRMLKSDGFSESLNPSLKWTGSKVGLVELLYALHSAQVFENGNASLHKIATFFEVAFGIEIGQYHRIFIEIKSRKVDRLRFLTLLLETLNSRIDDADKFS
jgi:hypothetical protein